MHVILEGMKIGVAAADGGNKEGNKKKNLTLFLRLIFTLLYNPQSRFSLLKKKKRKKHTNLAYLVLKSIIRMGLCIAPSTQLCQDDNQC